MDVQLPVATRMRELTVSLVVPAALWLAVLTGGTVLGQRGWNHARALPARAAEAAHRLQHLGGAALAVAAGCAVLAVAAACLVLRAAAALVRAAWFVRRVPFAGDRLTTRRRRIWLGHDQFAAEAERGDPAAAVRSAERRNAVCLAEPARPTWMGDRVAALRSRVRAEHGLDLSVTMPHVWLSLPQPARHDLTVLARAWQRSFLLGGWALLLVLTGAVWWPAAVAGACLWTAAILRGRSATEAFCAYLEAAVDLHVGAGPPAGTDPGPYLTALARKGT